MIQLSEHLEGLAANSWKRYFLSFILGAMGALAFYPLNFFPALILAFTLILLITDRAQLKKEFFRIGWFFGFGHFLVLLHWVSFALLIDSDMFGWLFPFAVLGIPMAMAIFPALSFLLFSLVKYKGWQKVVWFSLCWLASELLRSYAFSGFPWVLIGYSFSFSLEVSQFVWLVGIFGLSLIAIISATCPYCLLKKPYDKKFPALIAILLVAIFSYGKQRLMDANSYKQSSYKVRIVQGNIPQKLKWTEKGANESYFKHFQLSSPSKDDFDFIIWPESAITYNINTPGLLTHLGTITPKDGGLIVGAIRSTPDHSQQWNSLFLINQDGNIIDHYDKIHLVPFGEYVPFSKYLPLKKITHGMVDMSPGKKLRPLTLEKNSPKIAATICYEDIFPNLPMIDKNADFIVNITNDGWYGNSLGPYQHFDMARFRSIELGIPMLRAANTGISAIVDSYGRVVQSLKYNEEGVIEGFIPKRQTNIRNISNLTISILLIIFLPSLLIISRFKY
jgi:apolipoprotein N-acyltransferase